MKKLTWEEVLNEANRRGRILNEILELHAPEQIGDDWYCSHCEEYYPDHAPYPCETVRILLKHPGHEPLEAPHTEHGEPR